MITEERKKELLNATKYIPKGRPNPILKAIRSNPNLYSLICKVRTGLANKHRNNAEKELFKKNKELFKLNAFEGDLLKQLKENGFFVLPDFFDKDLISQISKKSDTLFRELKIIKNGGYHVSHKRIESLEGLSYEEIASFEHNIGIKDPLLNVPEVLSIVFNESILKVVSHYLQMVPSCWANISRAFPRETPVESSNFHKDTEESEIVQFFIYLLDVDGKRGPFKYVPKSHRHTVDSCKPRTGFDLGDNRFYGRVSDEEVEKVYPKETWASAVGGKGTGLVADVTGLHKGPSWDDYANPENQYRDVLRVQFITKGLRSHMSSDSIPKYKISKDSVTDFTELQQIFLRSYEVV